MYSYPSNIGGSAIYSEKFVALILLFPSIFLSIGHTNISYARLCMWQVASMGVLKNKYQGF